MDRDLATAQDLLKLVSRALARGRWVVRLVRKSGRELAERRHLLEIAGTLLLLETRVPGLFAGGVRLGSAKRVATAVGEGAATVLPVWH